MSDITASGQMRALDYAKREFQNFRGRYSHEIQQLMGAMAFSSNLEDSPYRNIFNNTTAWDEVATSFTREFCSLLKLSADSPLYIAATAGAIALPTLQKLQTIMQQKRTEWTTENELPVEIPLPPAYQFHSIFVCPVSKEQTTDRNPPMMMPCGHVVAEESLERLSKGTRFKCPYCLARSGSASRRSLGVSSCSAAVRMLSFMGRGRNAPAAGVAGPTVGPALLLGEGMREPLVAEGEYEEHRDRECKHRGIGPDRHPVVAARHAVAVGDEACGGEADEHPDAVGSQRDETLRGRLPCWPARVSV